MRVRDRLSLGRGDRERRGVSDRRVRDMDRVHDLLMNVKSILLDQSILDGFMLIQFKKIY